MRYTGGLAKSERERIFELFLRQYTVRFTDIENALGKRSNLVAYHVRELVKEGLLKKDGEQYSLTLKGERYIPIFSHVTGRELGPVPVILIAPLKGGKALLVKRAKRPYKEHWSLICGKLQFHETFTHACERKLAEYGIVGRLQRMHAAALERVEERGELKHSFLLFFCSAAVSAVPRGTGRWVSLKKLGALKIIPSDAWLLRKKLRSTLPVHEVLMHERQGELSQFRVR
jgi:ADP-ribose pyrophosphatase YjhB (NUDIX family)